MDDDPNEAYEVGPATDEFLGPRGWWTVKRNGIPVRHFGPDKRDLAERYAIDPEYRKSLVVLKLYDRKPSGRNE